MEVRNVGQGRQTNLDFNNSVDEVKSSQSVQTSSNSETDIGKVSEKDAKKAVDKFNKLMEDKSTHAEYEVYGKFKDITISIIDNNTKKVIKEIPPKKIIDMIDKFCEMAGMFLDEKV
ncbi:flagellar protein FlaG [Clostridium drakei]|uniref:Flagellar protein n=1 Tax=Clostridium drakei TaxID=332101 RepID=A0A2U8DM72_9CLOT|nr:flagellar protein FlaG [Clostridium drakei]AWI03668.1 flagellar protein [Clostridium drakei]